MRALIKRIRIALFGYTKKEKIQIALNNKTFFKVTESIADLNKKAFEEMEADCELMCKMYGIPKTLLGDLEKATFNEK